MTVLNPACRSGMLSAQWAESPYVHFVELDFVSGMLGNFPELHGEMWGGMALALLLPQKRSHELKIAESHRLLYDVARKSAVSQNRPDRLLTRLRWRLERLQRRKSGLTQ